MLQDLRQRALGGASLLALHRQWSEFNREAIFQLAQGRLEHAADPVDAALKPFRQRLGLANLRPGAGNARGAS